MGDAGNKKLLTDVKHLENPQHNNEDTASGKPKWQFDTIQIHAGLEDDPKYGHCTLPIYNTASFKFASSAALNLALSDIASSQNHLYSRVSNVSFASHFRGKKIKNQSKESPLH